MRNLSRCDALRAGSAAAIMTAAPAAGQAAIQAGLEADPVIALAQQVKEADWAWDAAYVARYERPKSKAARDLCGARERDYCELRAKLLRTRATSTEGVRAKMAAFYTPSQLANMHGGGGFLDPLAPEWAASIFRDLEWLAGEV